MPDKDDKPIDRRDFFGEAFRRVMRPVANYADKKLTPILEHLPDDEKPQPVTASRRLRPPGALPEKEFVETCLHSGNCAEACPVRAIRVWRSGDAANGTPFIDPNIQACVACETIACTQNCPSSALLKLTLVSQIHIGLAAMNHETCVRSHGEECRICVEKCPVPNAIRVGDDGRIEVLAGCVGCGVCEMYCPTEPKAIVVQARCDLEN